MYNTDIYFEHLSQPSQNQLASKICVTSPYKFEGMYKIVIQA